MWQTPLHGFCLAAGPQPGTGFMGGQGLGSQSGAGQSTGGSHGHHDPDYDQWRSEQLRNLDKDYEDWRKERYSKFSEEFNN